MLNRLKAIVKAALAAKRGRPALSPQDGALVEAIRAAKLTYLTDRRLATIAAACRRVDAEGVPGVFVEAGCALGGSTILIASVKAESRPLLTYDVFGMIPAPGDRDPPEVHERYRTIKEGASPGIDGDRYYGYEANLYEVVRANLRKFGVDQERQRVALVKGLVQETLRLDEQVAFAHVDVDWYEPVKTCLERIVPRLAPGGVLVLDDYNDWGGCRQATDEYLTGRREAFDFDDDSGSLSITRRRR